ncbi:glycerol-3-phosphate dehydrogenase (NAD(P)+) isoform 1 [Galdieria sulphuraria]|uniref:Glycerol-3-phosphate dehydrogenase [NAD(+)] n=1 Tax=Galdieria sulphuraria TaxID=130081 RepID=M2W3D8_GALSU|nr:glycerol-3-phosphate dehydrogenase (NAD(P)+) isoform 1 [Galdieria sulphuraria]EME30216.1 glycerol-3-phosphate dehydrogenase (NAD(P)+) isoform 1 [Galdieria sulphuraria]|eukprot:XP_005706736.1 glycerol-3-phosphate dehydrogenase (NAD(P)+) isoform 1 [Galdieria sulphuraria]
MLSFAENTFSVKNNMKSFFKEDPSFVLNTNCLNFCEHQTKFSVRNWFETHGKKGRKVPRGNVGTVFSRFETPSNVKITVIGGGSFGTAMSKVFGMKGYQVCLLVRDRNIVDGINQERRNPKYLREFTLPHSVFATSNVESALEGTQLVVHALPVQVSREVLERVAPFIPTGVPVLSTSKGLEVASHKFMFELLQETVSNHGNRRPLAFLSGPSFAKEIMQELPTAVVVACENLEIAGQIAAMLSSSIFKVFTTTDFIGVEVAGALKNIIAIAAGMAEGMGLGMNAIAGLVTRGCSEMRRVAEFLGGSSVTLSGLSGVGDTFLTCFGPLSRNRTVGYRLGKGESLNEILTTSQEVAEGVATAKAVVEWLPAVLNTTYTRALVRFPILLSVAPILEGKLTPEEGMQQLMAMPPTVED